MLSPIRVLIAEDHTVVRKGLKLLLDFEQDIEVVAEAVDGNEAVQLAREHKPSAIIMDICMPGINGIEATRQILKELPNTKVLIISNVGDENTIDDALSCGALGYISKQSSLLDVPTALRELLKGNAFISTAPARLRHD
jgi:DNA-binding NarL/FixJ family response regulator